MQSSNQMWEELDEQPVIATDLAVDGWLAQEGHKKV